MKLVEFKIFLLAILLVLEYSKWDHAKLHLIFNLDLISILLQCFMEFINNQKIIDFQELKFYYFIFLYIN